MQLFILQSQYYQNFISSLQPMGCGDSMVEVPRQSNTIPVIRQNYNNQSTSMFNQMQNVKRPKFLNDQLPNQQQRDILWAIIQKDSLKDFAYYLQSQRIPSNIEVGPANTFWNFAHFCARWDAFQCLHYIIKRVVAQKSTLLLSLVNQQTIQGYTAIHIAIQWNSLNCFYLLLDCGGVDLSYQDKANNDVFAKANLFKRQQMFDVLQKFRKGDALMVLAQSDRTRGFQDFSQLVASGKVEKRTEYRLTNQRLDYIIDTRNRINRPPPPPPPVVDNKSKYENYQKNMKQIESQNGETSYGESEQGQGQMMRKKLMEQKRFQQEQAELKRQQAENLKKRVQRQKEEEEERLRATMQQQIQKQIVYEQQQLTKIQKEKQLMRKNLEKMYSNSSQVQYSGKGTKMICPQDIRPIYEAALAKKTKYVDTQFPASQKSLGNIQEYRFGWKDCAWLRPEQIFPGGKFEVFDGISPDDIKQGTLSVCYYLALISSIAEHQKRIKKIFRFYDKDLGFYALQMYLQGRPKTIIVDDFFPCMKGTNQPLFAKPRGPQVWVMIFEKAWVKMFGNYLASEKMDPFSMFENVLPAPCRYLIVDVSEIQKTFDKLIDYDKKNYIMVTSSLNNDTPGIVEEHAYSLIGAYNINGDKLCKIRNPWAKTEYSGMYSESSTLWTPQLKQAVGFSQGDDGIFYLNPTELHTLMPVVTVSYYRDDYEYSHIEVNSKSNQFVYYAINLKKKSEISIKVTQQNQRFKDYMQYENAPIRFQIYRLSDNYEAYFLSQGEPSCMHGGIMVLYSNMDLFETFQPGRYLIRLKVMYDRAQMTSSRGTKRKFIRGTNGKDNLVVRQGSSTLSIYGPDKYVFNRLSEDEANKYMKNAYKNYILNSKDAKERMSAVGQDLKPMVQSKDCKMRNQIIYFAENLMTNYSINFTFQFSAPKLRNCSFAFNVDKQAENCKWVIPPGGWNLCTLQIDCPFQEVATDGELDSDYKIIR